MKKNVWIGLLMLLFVIDNAFAQEVIYAPYEKFDLRNGDFSVVGKVGNQIYTYRSSSDGFFLDVYNDNMEKTAMVMLDFFPKKIYETRFVSYSDKIIVLYQGIETGRVVQYAALLDNKGRLLKGPLSLASAKTGIWGPSRSYFSSAISDDKKHIVVYGIEEKNNELQFTGTWIDDQLTVTGKSTAGFKSDNRLSRSDGFVDNKGVFYLQAFTPDGTRNYSDRAWILALTGGARKFYAKELPLNGKYTTSIYMKPDNANNRIYVGGFYSDRKNGNYEGVLYAYLDLNDSNWQNRRNIAFDEHLRNATGERNLKRAFNDYQVRHMIIKKDGGFVLISEDFFMTLRTTGPGWGGFYYSYYYSPFMSQNIREFNYNDLFAISYDGAGNKEWHAFVRKNQYSQEDGGVFSSFGLINTGGSIGLLFNDFNTRASRIQLATIDPEGMVGMRSLAAGSANDPDWLPRSGKQTGLKEMVIPCLRRKQISFAKIVF